MEDFYEQNAQKEWERLEQFRMEFAVTLRAFHDHLPGPPADVLDIGGGPGRYAIALTQQGYRVTLVDLSRENVKLAGQKRRNPVWRSRKPFKVMRAISPDSLM